jgi:rod shape-determining protein MreD
MRLKVLAWAFSVIVFLLLQTTWLEYVKIMGVKPNLVLVFVVIVALLCGHIVGAVGGFFAGLAMDLLAGKYLGLYALLMLYVGLACGYLTIKLYKENYLVMLFFVILSSIAFEFAVYFLTSLDGNMELYRAFTRKILPEAGYNCIAALIIYYFALKVLSRLNEREKPHRKY